jgi:anti-sigma factor RsiW
MSFLGKWRKPEHQWVEESLSAYMDGELSPAETARVENHLRECEACTENLTTLRQTVALLQELPAKPAPRSFAVRPASVKARRAAVPSAWGYGLLKGATALAALLLVVLIGGDLALRFVGAPMASLAPAAPAAEVAMVPSYEPEMAPVPVEEEEAVLGHTKATEPSSVEVPPANGEEAAAPAPAPTESADFFEAPQEMASPAARAEDAGPAGTPTSPPPSGEAPADEEQGVGAGEPVTATAALATPTPCPPGEEGGVPTAQPEATRPPSEWTQEHAAVPSPTPPVLAMADEPHREADVQEYGGEQPGAEALPLSPLRLAELMAFALLVVLGAATALSAWLGRPSD